MDEPFGALDPMTRTELHGEFRRIQDRVHKTVILVTHDMAEAITLGDRLGVLEGGRLIACDRPDAMLFLRRTSETAARSVKSQGGRSSPDPKP